MNERAEDAQKKGQEDEPLKDLDVAEEDAEEVTGGAINKAIDKANPDRAD